MANKRIERVAEEIQRKLSSLIIHELKDPRLPKFISISGVKLTPDLAHAKVYFSVYESDPDETAHRLNSCAGFLRKSLAQSMKLRIIPALHFVYDVSIAYGEKITGVINSLNIPDSDLTNDDSAEN